MIARRPLAGAGLEAREIGDADEWERLVDVFPDHDVKQGFEWGEVRRPLGWRPVRYAVVDGEQPLATCAILARMVPGAGALLYAPRGPLLAGDDRALTALLEPVRDLARRTGAILLRASPAEPAVAAALGGAGFVALEDEFTAWNTPRCTASLDLRAPEDVLWARVRGRTREYVRGAPRRGMVVGPSRSIADVEEFHPLIVALSRQKQIPLRSLAYHRHLYERFSKAGRLRMFTARADGRLVGALLAVRSGARATMLHAATDAGAPGTLRHYVSPALYWAFIRSAREEGCTLADFGPSGVGLVPRPTDPGWGVFRFKASFGCAARTYPPFHDLVFRPRAYRLLRLAERRMLPALWHLAASHARLAAALTLL